MNQHVIERVRGVWLLAAQKPINSPGWQKGKCALFYMPATAESGVVDGCPKPLPSRTSKG